MAISRGLVRLLALTCGMGVANIYYAQPLLHTIAVDLGVGESATGFVVTATQLGFGLGLLFVVPLGDITARRPLITLLLALDALVLAAAALAPGLSVLIVFSVLIGLCSVVIQVIIPYGATLASDQERAATIGTLMSSLLLGILLSRTFAGLVGSVGGWRGVFAVAALLMAVMAVVHWRVLPATRRELNISFGTQLRSVVRVAAGEPVLRWRALIGAAQFAAFGCFWTTVTFLLSGPAFGFNQAQIGLYALVGAAGAVCALGVGRLLERRELRWPATGIGLLLLLVSFGLLALGEHGLAWLIVGALLMDACSQGVHVSNLAVIYDLVNEARSRLTSVYMTTYFLGGAVGTTLGTAAYRGWGWLGACTVAGGFCVLGLLGWLATRRHERPRAVVS